MFNVKRGLHMFIDNPLSSFVVAIVLAVAMTAVCFVANYVSKMYSVLDCVKGFDGEYTIYFNANNSAGNIDTAKLIGLESVSGRYEIQFSSEGGYIQYQSYDGLLATKSGDATRLIKGNWYYDAPLTAGEFNAVIIENDVYDVGDLIFARSLFSGQSDVKIRVTGILPKDCLLYSFTGWSVPASVEMMLTKYGGTNKALFLIGDVGAITDKNVSASGLYVFNPNVSAEEMKANLDYLNIYGNTAKVGEMIEGSRNQINNTVSAFVPTAVIMLVLCLVGLFTLTSITVEENKKTFSLLFYCGAKKSDVAAAVLSYVGTIYIAGTLLFACINSVLNARLTYDTYAPQRGIFWGVTAISLVLTSVIAVAVALKAGKNISRTIKEE